MFWGEMITTFVMPGTRAVYQVEKEGKDMPKYNCVKTNNYY